MWNGPQRGTTTSYGYSGMYGLAGGRPMMTAIDMRGWLQARRARRPALSVVVPTLNEAGNLAGCCPSAADDRSTR